MTLRERNNGRAIEVGIVALVIEVFLAIVALDGRSKIADSLLGAYEGSGLATSGSLNMSDEVKESVLVIGAGSVDIIRRTELGGGGSAPQSIDLIIDLLTEGLRNLADKSVEVNAAGKDAVELFVNLNSLQGGGNGNFGLTSDALTTDALGALSSPATAKRLLSSTRKTFSSPRATLR